MITKRIRDRAHDFLDAGWDEVGINPRDVLKMCDRIDALEAHVERLEHWIRNCNQYARILNDTPATSLARHDAELMKAWANRLEELADNARENEYSEHAEGMQDAAVETMEEADRLRRQAEGGE